MDNPFALLSTVVVGLAMLLLPQDPQPPKLEDIYWGPGEQPDKEDTSIRPFNISFSDEMIDDLRYRLKSTRRLEPSLENSGWTYGVGRTYIPVIIDYWLNKYDFKKREDYLNQFPQFITKIQGLDIHYIHVKPQLPENRKDIKILPLLILHGWSASIVEAIKLIPKLTTPRQDKDFVFEVIAPSLPGFAYSDAAAKIGLTSVDMAHLYKNFMIRLGYDKWYTQGGDWGAVITAHMASIYPQYILGIHSNFCIVITAGTILKLGIYSIWPSLLLPEERSVTTPLSKVLQKSIEMTGYFHEQATRPDTLGVGLTDSPAALAAYILEKYSDGTSYEGKMSFDGHLSEHFDMDDLIDNLMLYWAPEKITSSMRIYAETFNSNTVNYTLDSLPINVPSACAQFPEEILFLPEKILRDRYVNLVHRTIMPRGGHYAALEEPQLLADDVWKAVKKMREYDASEVKKAL